MSAAVNQRRDEMSLTIDVQHQLHLGAADELVAEINAVWIGQGAPQPRMIASTATTVATTLAAIAVAVANRCRE